MRHSSHHRCRPACRCARGFALVVTLSLMILLTVIAVGLLSLSSIALRQASASSDREEAMANARLSLMLALGDLQKQLGPDRRISAAADQLQGATPDSSGADVNRRQWTGVYEAWPAPVSATSPDTRPTTPTFCQWLVSGNASDLETLDFAKNPGEITRELVGHGTLGNAGNGAATSGVVTVPVVDLLVGGKTTSRFAWWVGDQGMKAAMSTTQASTPVDLAGVRAGLQGAPRNAVQLAKAGASTMPFSGLGDSDARLPFVSDFNQMGLLASGPKTPAPLFHDLVSHSSGLLTNVRTGGFRKDLSMYFEKTIPPTGGFPLGISKDALYQVNGVDGIRGAEIWAYYNLYKQLKTDSIEFTTGGSGGGASNPYLQSEDTDVKAKADPWFYYKRPVIIGYKAMFSFYATPATGTPPVSRLALCVDPVITFWNPYDVPVALDPAFNTIRFEKIPYQINDLKVTTATSSTSVSVLSLGGGTQSFMGQANYVILYAGNSTATKGVPVILKPGEVLLYSQGAATTPLQGSLTTGSFVYGKPGFNFGGGIYYVLKDSAGAAIPLPGGDATVEFASITPTANQITSSQTPTPISVNHFETYLFDDRTVPGSPHVTEMTLGIGGAFVDSWHGLPPYQDDKQAAKRFTADQKTAVFKSLPGGQFTLSSTGNVNDSKRWFLYCAYDLKTEEDALRPGQFMSRLNPSAPLLDFADLSETELDVMPLEIRIESNSNGAGQNVPIGLDCVPSGQGYLGGGLTGESGTTTMTTHSVPLEPIVSLAALQHSQANGFTHDSPDLTNPFYLHPYGGKILSNMSIRFPMLPQIAHAIGNSLAPAILASDKTTGDLTGRSLADHSYLSNKALWDDWFFSGISPHPAANLTQNQVAEKFLNDSKPLPVARYRPALGTETATAALARLFAGTQDQPENQVLAASMIRVDGLFNVNSTSVEAWKAVLGGLKNHPVVTRADNGAQSLTSNNGSAPVPALLAPTTAISGSASNDVKDPAQWTGRRTLDDTEIDSLAKKLVSEIRRRGPFLSLADFINRRPGSDKILARAGAVQSAIDASIVNASYASRMAEASASLAFPEAEKSSPAAQGIAGVVKQGDVLTPIAPILSARSDSFILRGYGEKLDRTGTKVLARAYCEAVVERDREFTDAADSPEKITAQLNRINQRFGRRFLIRSFRWLNANEI